MIKQANRLYVQVIKEGIVRGFSLDLSKFVGLLKNGFVQEIYVLVGAQGQLAEWFLLKNKNGIIQIQLKKGLRYENIDEQIQKLHGLPLEEAEKVCLENPMMFASHSYWNSYIVDNTLELYVNAANGINS